MIKVFKPAKCSLINLLNITLINAYDARSIPVAWRSAETVWNKSVQQQIPAQISSGFVDIWENDCRKTCSWLTIEAYIGYVHGEWPATMSALLIPDVSHVWSL